MVSWLLIFVAVSGLALTVSGSHVHCPRMFAGSSTVCGYTTGPAFAITGGGPVSVLQRLVFDVWIGVGGKAPDSGDLFGHVGG